MKIRLICSLVIMVVIMFMSQPCNADDLADLKATHAEYPKALNSHDVEKLFELFYDEQIRVDQFGGFPSVLPNNEQVKAAWAGYFESLEIFRTTYYSIDYRVIGNTGLVWGIRTEVRKLKNRPTKNYLLSTTIVYIKNDGKWKRVVTHSSPIISETRTP